MYPWPELTVGLELVRKDRRGRKHERLRQENQSRSLAVGGRPLWNRTTSRPWRTRSFGSAGTLEQTGRRGHAAFPERFDRPVATDPYRRLLEQAAGRGR
jgi:hypothetical protein